MDNQSVTTNPASPTPAPTATPAAPTSNPVSPMPTPPEQASVSESRALLWPKIVIVLLIIVACIEVGYIIYKQNSVVVVEEAASVNP